MFRTPVTFVFLATLWAPAMAGDGAEGSLREQFTRWQCSMRDAVDHAAQGLVQLAGTRIPDLSILTTDPVAHTESSGFGWRDDPIRHRPRFHSGTDFRGERGTPILAAGAGVVVFAGRMGGYGNMIEVDHGGGVHTRYAHLRRIMVKVDGAVLAGQQIGQMGATGRTTGTHLHFEVRLDDQPVDPVTAMSVAQLERESPDMGRIAAYALDPEIQANVASSVDPPRSKIPTKTKKPAESRPDRPGRVRVVKPLS